MTLDRAGPLAGELGQARLVELMRGAGRNGLGALAALAGLLRREAPQVHYAFLPTCTVRAAVLAPFVPATRLVLGIRATDTARGPNAPGRLAGRLLLELEARLSPLADLVIANSEAARAACVGRGFAPGRLRVVPNGVDTARFRPDRSLGAALRRQWGVVPGQTLVGVAARLDPHKGHAVFLEAAALASAARPDLRFVCLGGGRSPWQPGCGCGRWRGSLGLRDWAGEQADMPARQRLDLLCPLGTGAAPNVLPRLGRLRPSGHPVGDCTGCWEIGVTVAPESAALARGRVMWTCWPCWTGAGRGRGLIALPVRVDAMFSLERMVAKRDAAYGDARRVAPRG